MAWSSGFGGPPAASTSWPDIRGQLLKTVTARASLKCPAIGRPVRAGSQTAAGVLVRCYDGDDLVQPGDLEHGSDRPGLGDCQGEAAVPGCDEQDADGGAVAVGDRGHVDRDLTGDGGGLGERGMEAIGVGQVDVARSAHGRGLLPVAGHDVETCLHVAICDVAAGSIAGGSVFGHCYSSLLIVTVVPCSVVLMSTWSMRACMKAIP